MEQENIALKEQLVVMESRMSQQELEKQQLEKLVERLKLAMRPATQELERVKAEKLEETKQLLKKQKELLQCNQSLELKVVQLEREKSQIASASKEAKQKLTNSVIACTRLKQTVNDSQVALRHIADQHKAEHEKIMTVQPHPRLVGRKVCSV